jgi:hypothetical protein
MTRTLSSRLTTLTKVLGGSTLLFLSVLAGLANGLPEFSGGDPDPIRNGQHGTRTALGPAQALGAGTAHAFVTTTDGVPVALGVRVTETALATLPAHGNAHGSHDTVLLFPAGVASAPFDHISFDWQPQGHVPDGVYTIPHFDVHFYMMSAAERDAITPTSPTFATEAAVTPDASVVPAGYVPTPDILERMGIHWVDPSSPEFTPAGFSRTFIYGYWNGRMNFLEPMLTKDFIESVKAMPGQSVSFPIPQPAVYEKAGHYPTVYGVRYDADAQAYDIVLEGLMLRTVPTT